MQKTSLKRNALLVILLMIAIIALFAAIFVPHAVYAEVNVGNNAGAGSDAGKTFTLLAFDVNGRSQTLTSTTDYDTSAVLLENSNTIRYRKRYIHTAAVSGSTMGEEFSFIKSSITNSSADFTVKLYTDDNEATKGDIIEVEALSITLNGAGYFSVDIENNSTAERNTLYFKVIVLDSFVQCNRDEKLYVGYKVNAAGNEINSEEKVESSLKDGVHQSILTINNYDTTTIDLSSLLLGHALYRDSARLMDGATASWTVKSVTNFAIDSATFPEISGLSLQRVSKSSTRNDNAFVRVVPYITGRIEIPSTTVDAYDQLPANKNIGRTFWNSVHNLQVSLSIVTVLDVGDLRINMPTSATIVIPVKFAPANPQKKSIPSSRLRLNITSENTYYLNTQTNSDLNSSDYGAIYIRPSDLIEYSAPAGLEEPTFNHFSTSINDDSGIKSYDGLRIERVTDKYELDEDPNHNTAWPKIYKISAIKSEKGTSTFTVKFLIHYYDATGGKDYETSIIVTTYGDYAVDFDQIRGTDAVTYNAIDSGVFQKMRDLGYYLSDAESLDKNLLVAKFSNNVLTLTPNADKIANQATAKVRLEFINLNRQRVSVISEIDIDVKAGSFSALTDWKKGVIIAAAVVGGLIIILLIVWIFIRSLSKHKQDELAMQAPVSSYIVKLNSTIAATQAQQRMAQNQALSQASTQMLLGAGPAAGAAPLPDTLQLATGVQSTPSMSTPSSPLMSEPQAAVPPEAGENLEELIAKYISDEELLERIFTEKYEPKGMIRRTFFKSKDLQARELDKEKKRIIERYKTPMPMDEAIMSEAEIQKAGASSSPAATSSPAETEQQVVEYFTLDFDPDAPLYVEEEKAADEFTEEKIDLDVSPEESRLRSLEHQNDVLAKELAELKSRLDKVLVEVNNAKSMEAELREKIAKAESDDEQFAKDIEDLEFKLASAKNKDKEKITRDIGIKEEKKKRNWDELEKLRRELEAILDGSDRVNGIYEKLNELQQQKTADTERINAELDKAKSEYDSYVERMEILRKRQELAAKVESLEPLLQAVNNTDYEMRRLDAVSEEQEKERESLKSSVATAKSQILGATDFGIIADLNAQISDANAQLSELEREITKATKQKSDLSIEFNSQRRKANDFITKNDIPLEEVIKVDDKVLGAIEFEIVKAAREKDKEQAEKAVATAQAVYEDLSASSNDVTMIAMEVAAAISELEEEIAQVQAQLDEINAQMEAASEDEKLELMVAQGDTSDKLEELKAKLEQTNVDGTKRKMEAQAGYDEQLEQARAALDRANDEYEQSCKSFDDFVNNTNPLDLITSGCGIISKDQKKLEAENLKKQLERSKLEAEQARLAAQQAQEQAEETRRKAQEEAEAARLETERAAQEVIERAEKARIEAEEKAKADIEAAEQARREAEESLAAEAEEAKRKALEEAEEARRQAEADSEEARRQAEEDLEAAKRQAEAEVEEAKLRAQEEIEQMRRKAEEEAEAKRLEEENKRKEEEARQKAEAERAEAIAKKVALRRDQIIAIRNEMKDLKGDEEAKNLRERLYNLQLTFDEDERGATELMDFYNKTMDDIQSSGEIARLKAENAKKPQRVVRKVTERVNRIPKRKAGSKGARPAARPGARPAARPGARPAARPGARPAARPGARPAARPGARPGGNRPTRPR